VGLIPFWCLINFFIAILVKGLPKNCELVKQEEQEIVISHGEKVKGIREVLARDHMKVAFFGR